MTAPEWLPRARKLYVEKGLSFAEVGRRLGVSHTAVSTALHKAGVKTRTHKEAQWLWFTRAKKAKDPAGFKNKDFDIRRRP